MFSYFSKDLKDFVAATTQLVQGATTEDREFYGDERIPYYGQTPPLTGTSAANSSSSASGGGGVGSEMNLNTATTSRIEGFHGDCPRTPLRRLQSTPATYDAFATEEQEKFERQWCLAEQNRSLVQAIADERMSAEHGSPSTKQRQPSDLCEEILRRNPDSVARFYDLYVAEQGKLSSEQFFERYLYRLTTTREQCSLAYRKQVALKVAAEERFYEREEAEEEEAKAAVSSGGAGLTRRGIPTSAGHDDDPWADESDGATTTNVPNNNSGCGTVNSQQNQQQLGKLTLENRELLSEVERLNALVQQLEGRVEVLEEETATLKMVVRNQSAALVSSPTALVRPSSSTARAGAGNEVAEKGSLSTAAPSSVIAGNSLPPLPTVLTPSPLPKPVQHVDPTTEDCDASEEVATPGTTVDVVGATAEAGPTHCLLEEEDIAATEERSQPRPSEVKAVESRAGGSITPGTQEEEVVPTTTTTTTSTKEQAGDDDDYADWADAMDE